jgi:hypothetical protein
VEILGEIRGIQVEVQGFGDNQIKSLNSPKGPASDEDRVDVTQLAYSAEQVCAASSW